MTVLEEGADSDDEDDDDDGSAPMTSFPLESFRVVVHLLPHCREAASLQMSTAGVSFDAPNTEVGLPWSRGNLQGLQPPVIRSGAIGDVLAEVANIAGSVRVTSGVLDLAGVTLLMVDVRADQVGPSPSLRDAGRRCTCNSSGGRRRRSRIRRRSAALQHQYIGRRRAVPLRHYDASVAY